MGEDHQPLSDAIIRLLELAYRHGFPPEAVLASLTDVYSRYLAMFYAPDELPAFYEREAQSARDDMARPSPVAKPALQIIAGGANAR